MRFHTYTKFNPQLADAVDLQSLLDQLADFLLQSGFAGGEQGHWGADQGEGDRSMDSLKDAILRALIESGQITPEMLSALRGEGDEVSEEKLAELRDNGALQQIYAHIISLFGWDRLVALQIYKLSEAAAREAGEIV